ncbi:Sphingolipid delta(4)-desaturase [Wickerhamiella sorbophila]|uniref:sphingolipid 4-desaturase n=1 Tax=Wickerhamiella sorbophila TaxID=45607 RepID=A0A2T0FJW2_9ASCO|nr:Sphingolipid delta(4)-desaturase [Wickerhamiella sorbophila]PRT55257.1 Sphingolipid delta(4)-desaturase [Wickerhamiella sorbophila]
MVVAEKSPLSTAEKLDPRYYLTYREEPHRTRRMQIIAAHPEVTKLNGHEPLTKWVVLGVVTLQFTCAYLLRNSSFSDWKFWLTAYIIGATCCSNVFLAIHEFSHNLGFKKPLPNRLFSIVANLPVGIPYSASFGPFHLLHHKHMGEPDYDTDLPTPLEALVLSNIAGKAFFATFQLFFYAIRPACLVPMEFTWVHYLNIAVQFAADYILVKTCGWMSFFYLLASAFLSGSLHPLAGHFISEHYVFEHPVKSPDTLYPETYSYYGPLNIFFYNAGYHSEHHDFPFIPWTRIKELRRIATEFYDPLPCHMSLTKVLIQFIFDPQVTLWCRVERPSHKERKAAATAAEIE